MIRLPKSLKAWGLNHFSTVLKQEVEALNPQYLPLQQGLALSSHVTNRPIQVMVIAASDTVQFISVKAGVFYTGVIAGCNCADDPSPIDEQNEYCVIQLDIDKTTSDTQISLVPD